MKSTLPALFAAASLAAASLESATACPVEIEPRMNALDIKGLTSSGTPLAITFVNAEGHASGS